VAAQDRLAAVQRPQRRATLQRVVDDRPFRAHVIEPTSGPQHRPPANPTNPLDGLFQGGAGQTSGSSAPGWQGGVAKAYRVVRRVGANAVRRDAGSRESGDSPWNGSSSARWARNALTCRCIEPMYRIVRHAGSEEESGSCHAAVGSWKW